MEFKRTERPNKVLINGDVCEMELYDKNRNLVAVTKFNSRHLNKIKNYRWGYLSNGYTFNNTYDILLHHLILKKRKGLEVDHIDTDKLNNLDDNLRYLTHAQNARNRKANGVCWDKSKKKWRAYLKLNYKMIFNKRFKTKEEAIKARKEAEAIYFGEYAYKGN